jgi:hypothetical protein
MTKAQQTIVNDKDAPIYITIEPAPECYELEPGESLTLIYDVPQGSEELSMHIIKDGIVIWPIGDEPEVLVNGDDAQGRSWKFKHHGRSTD